MPPGSPEASPAASPLTEGTSDAAGAAAIPHDGGAAGKPGAGVSPEEKLLTTGEMARLSNSTLRTVRFYEEEGILRPAKRTDGGHRLFRKTELDRLLFVSDLRTAGLSLDDIKEILELKKSAGSGEAAAKEARRIFSARIHELEEKVAVLTRLRDEFTRTSDIVSACLSCRDNERFPDACGDCSVMSSHTALPRSARVVWSVGAAPGKPLVSPVDDDAAAHPTNDAGASGAGATKAELGRTEG